jgi:hypothetical protein
MGLLLLRGDKSASTENLQFQELSLSMEGSDEIMETSLNSNVTYYVIPIAFDCFDASRLGGSGAQIPCSLAFFSAEALSISSDRKKFFCEDIARYLYQMCKKKAEIKRLDDDRLLMYNFSFCGGTIILLGKYD